jgi:restriction system protein
MGRRSGFTGFMISAARASARAARQAEAHQRRVQAANIRQLRYLERENAKQEKEAIKREKQEYLESRLSEAAEETEDAQRLFEYLSNGIVSEALRNNNNIIFEDLIPKYEPPALEIPRRLQDKPNSPSKDTYLAKAGSIPFLGKIFKSQRLKWENKCNEAVAKFETDLLAHKNALASLDSEIMVLRSRWEKDKSEYDVLHELKSKEIKDFEDAYLDCEMDAVIEYISMVLDKSEYDFDWEHNFKVAYSPNSKEAVVEFELPRFDVIPVHAEFRYIKAKDSIEPKIRKKQEIETAYSRLISAISIRTIYEIIKTDKADAIAVLGFNGYVDAVDPKTGKPIAPVLISLSVSKREFNEILLDRVDPIKCVRGLSASFSTAPCELVPVKPIREYSMIDRRFVTEEDVASKLDDKANLMDLDPFEFENLVSNLFSKMGLETKQTRSSRDGGVDAIAFDTRPIIGGKVVIQAKRYKNTVGVSAVRDLYGTMINEGASKGILVATSGYGPDAYEFSKDKPIELVDGGGLLFLLDQVGIKAKIILPE